MSNVREFRPKTADSEKITINLGYVDLGQIDLLVQEGFYSNRTDFIRTAIRNQLDRHTDAVQRSVVRHQLDLGLRRFRFAVRDVMEHRIVEKHGFLCNQRDLTSQARDFRLAEIDAIPEHSAGHGIVKAGKKFCERRFPAA